MFKANLSPQGVCYVSYNAYPYSHARNLARDMVLFHTRGMSGFFETRLLRLAQFCGF